ncbi:aminopeptidase N-like [Aedes albopictus]|uniref:Aminopeptidase n=1 Tax=Aedes albopictus TaxID=7160 RepID=A0ABM1YWX2_AEDAL|nr:aminopeptidase N-like [Aedes albopictus]
MTPWNVLVLFCAISAVSGWYSHPRARDGYSLPDLISTDEKFEAYQQRQDAAVRNPIEAPYRIPNYIVPFHYGLWLRTGIHEGNLTFDGRADLYFRVTNPVRTIYVHSRGLNLINTELYMLPGDDLDGDRVLLERPRYTINQNREFIIFSSQRILVPTESYILHVEYSAELRTDDDGIYVSTYMNENRVRRHLIATQFQAISARTAFPCFDEPALKATFNLQIVHAEEYSAVSNTPVMEIEDYEEDGFQDYVTTKFERTPRMSPYLLAFLVSDFKYIAEGNQRVFTRPNAINQTEYALASGLRTLQAMDEYLGIPYTTHMSKLDQAAIPDFDAGAMENWGLCKYRESLLLFDPAVTTYRTRTWIDTIISHEYIHQWFGNKITNEWWSYLWLNEGFATLYEYYGAHLAAPEMEYFELFTLDVTQWALDADSREGTRPMSFSNGATFYDIWDLFDSIAYSKAGAVLNMFRGVLGDEVWRLMSSVYLSDNELEAVNPNDLIAAMEEASKDMDTLPEGVSMREFVESWTEQTGYPVLEVRRNYRTDEIILSQDRFFNNKVVNNDPTEWIVPYNVVNQSAADFEFLNWDWLTERAVRLSTNVPDDRWIMVNKLQTGFYRVNYDVQNWYLIIDALIANWASVHRYNRAQLLDDAFHLARANRLDMEVFLDLMVYLQNEVEYPAWTAASPIISYFYNRLRGTPHYEHFQHFIYSLLEHVYGTLSIDSVSEDETNLHKFLKQTVSTWACRIENEDCLNRTHTLLSETVDRRGLVHPDISAVTYCFGLRGSTEREFVYVYDVLKTSDNQALRTLLIDSLGCSDDRTELRAYLYTAVGGEIQVNYTPAERRRVLNAVIAGSREGVDVMIDFLVDLYDYVLLYLGQGMLNSLVGSIASKTNNEEELERLEHLLGSLGSSIPPAVANSARATAARNMAWTSSREGLIVTSFLESFSNNEQRKK